MSTAFARAYIAALATMTENGPGPLHETASFLGRRDVVVADDEALRNHLNATAKDDQLRKRLHLDILTWDNIDEADWAAGTERNSDSRRAQVLRLLEVDLSTASLINHHFPIASTSVVCIADEDDWQPWYTEELKTEHDFYWNSYKKLLERKNWEATALAALDDATTEVIGRLSAPTRFEAYQSKGLVVGHVQSGKTANFTGVAAKAIDAGYRLIIVLTGTTDMLRSQTQRRLDMELIGVENILSGVDPEDQRSLDEVDYQQDADWHKGKFLKHGVTPNDVDRPAIHRLTTHAGDYKSLKQGIEALNFPKVDKQRHFFDEPNLYPADAKVAVVKKNAPVLRKLVGDLHRIKTKTNLGEIPTLIIDDESDQASVNTSNPKNWAEGKKVRSSINDLISQLLKELPRAQYVGYSATPFANVFIDPGDTEDIFPKDFLISLNPPPNYMGAADFHDFDFHLSAEERLDGASNRNSHVRFVETPAGDDEQSLQQAIDTFVLTGALKLYRESLGLGTFKHHTMLVHETMRTAEQSVQADRIRALWSSSGYYSATSHERLRVLFERDIAATSRARAGHSWTPTEFGTLLPHIATAVTRIGNPDPVLVVNSDKDATTERLDFDQDDVWRILVGGNKLARGFTVEGLTVSYFLRKTKLGDAMMQMGRWFGFRKHYSDLVRLFLTEEIYEGFEAIALDEMHFRDELRRYATPVDGQAQVTPKQVPPLVAQHLPWIKPTSAKKMYNARLVERRSPGSSIEPTAYPGDSAVDDLRWNTEAMYPLLEAASVEAEFKSSRDFVYSALHGFISHATLLDVLAQLRWAKPEHILPDLRWLNRLGPEKITGWDLVFPFHRRSGGATRNVLGCGPFGLFERDRRDNRGGLFGAISDPKHRSPVRQDVPLDASQEATSRNGTMLVYPISGAATSPDDPASVIMAFRLEAPGSATAPDGRLVTFTARNSAAQKKIVIDRPDIGQD